ncbi:F-box only protein 6-like [Dermacentor andersoni]|uniref:F-box only protein 6-like n=1 Tax=Dermacentor andersoni TaxID=34620 RepID=UPI002155F12E|nr:F-box only protein 6-like [Dermacentor andersoni]
MKHIKRFLFSAPSAERPMEPVDPFPLMNLPEPLIEYVLSFVSHTDLLKSCRNTCKPFRDIIDSNSFWKIKCLRDGRSIPSFHLEELPPRYYQRIYIGNPYGRNLLQNGHGDSPKGAFASWRIIENGGDGWKYEATPKGADPLPLDKQGCFSTSYGACTKQQVISLASEGVLPEIMDNFKPHIEVSEWHAARFDCGCEYRLTVSLLNEKRKVLHEFTTGPIVTEQWLGREWSQVTHVFRDYPSGVRFVQFQHYGCDTQFWAGNFGSKMAGGVVRVRGNKQEPVAAEVTTA